MECGVAHVLTITEQYRITADPKTCFDTFINLRPEEFLHTDALIAAVESSSVNGGGLFNQVGAMQTIRFTDRAVIEETLTELVPGRKMGYRGRGFTQPIVGWAEFADASFEFLSDRDSTIVVWNYAFTLREGPFLSAKALVFEQLFLNVVYRRFMKKTLRNLAKIVTLRLTVGASRG
jgi:hypothetical protein